MCIRDSLCGTGTTPTVEMSTMENRAKGLKYTIVFGMLSRHVRSPKFGTNVTGSTRKTRIWFCYRYEYYRKEKTPMDFHQRGYTCVDPPRGHMCSVPPGTLMLLPQGTIFPPQGINVCCPPPWACAVESCIQKSSILSQVYTAVSLFHVSVPYRENNCYPPPTSVTCVLPLPVTYIPTSNITCYNIPGTFF